MVAVVGEERRLAGRAVGGVVVCEFRGREKLFPVVLLVVAEDAQVLLESLVDALGLAVSLRMKGRRHVGLDVGESEKVSGTG